MKSKVSAKNSFVTENKIAKIEKVSNVIYNLLTSENYIENTNFSIKIEDKHNLVFREINHPYVKITGKTLSHVFRTLKDLFEGIEITIIGDKVARFTLPSKEE